MNQSSKNSNNSEIDSGNDEKVEELSSVFGDLNIKLDVLEKERKQLDECVNEISSKISSGLAVVGQALEDHSKKVDEESQKVKQELNSEFSLFSFRIKKLIRKELDDFEKTCRKIETKFNHNLKLLQNDQDDIRLNLEKFQEAEQQIDIKIGTSSRKNDDIQKKISYTIQDYSKKVNFESFKINTESSKVKTRIGLIERTLAESFTKFKYDLILLSQNLNEPIQLQLNDPPMFNTSTSKNIFDFTATNLKSKQTKPKFQITYDVDDIVQNGNQMKMMVRQQSITFMKEYENISFEELRLEDMKNGKTEKSGLFQLTQ